MSVLRHNFSRKAFICVMNEVAQDEHLSFAARGLLVHMVSLPEEWEFSADRLARQCPASPLGEGRDRVLGLMRELELHGYVKRVRESLGRGRIRTVTVVSDEPVKEWVDDIAAGRTGNGVSGVGEPDSDNPPPEKRHKKNNKQPSDPSDRPDMSGSDSASPHRHHPVGDGSRSRNESQNAAAARCCDLGSLIKRSDWTELHDRYVNGENDVYDLIVADLDHNATMAVEAMLDDGRHLKAAANYAHSQLCDRHSGESS